MRNETIYKPNNSKTNALEGAYARSLIYKTPATYVVFA